MLFGGIGAGITGVVGTGNGWIGFGITGTGVAGTGWVGLGNGSKGGPPFLSVWAEMFNTTIILIMVRDSNFRRVLVFIINFSFVFGAEPVTMIGCSACRLTYGLDQSLAMGCNPI
jgi:hypothetical protein